LALTSPGTTEILFSRYIRHQIDIWARKVTTSEIRKNRTESDKEKLGGLDYQKRKKNTRKRRSANRALYPQRQNKHRRMTPAFTNLSASLTNAQILNEEEDERQHIPSPTVDYQPIMTNSGLDTCNILEMSLELRRHIQRHKAHDVLGDAQ
jgi:hypothetical protein